MNRFTLFDAHVHIYPCYDLGALLDAASANFRQAAQRLAHDDVQDARMPRRPERAGSGPASDGVLCLTEGAKHHWFSTALAALEPNAAPVPWLPAPGWRLARGSDAVTLTADHRDGQRLYLLAGHQIVTAERLEVLALGLVEKLPDGGELGDTLLRVKEAGAVAILPWGAGKWLGRRGAVVSRLVQSGAHRDVALGDNGNRPWAWPLSNLFRASGARNLPGSDPLPFPGEEQRAGAYGFVVAQALDDGRPLRLLKDFLAHNRTQPPCYGATESLPRFLRNQIRMQLPRKA